jgi:outer membrane protein TolC
MMTIKKVGRSGIRLVEVVWLPLVLFLVLPGGRTLAQEAGGFDRSGNGRIDAEVQGQSTTLSLSEAVRTALRQSRDIQDARLALAEAEERVDEAWGSIFPKIDFSASYTRNIAPAVAFFPAEFAGGEPGEFRKVQFGADNAWATALVLDQPLFAASAFIGVGAAGRFQALQEETVRGRAQTLVTRVRLAYYNLLLAQEDRRLIENSVNRVRQSLEETEALNRAGLASDYDVLRLQVQLANLEPNLRRTENAVNQARRSLAVELNIEELETLSVEGNLASMDLEDLEANDAPNREILTLSGLRDPIALQPSEVLGTAYEARSDLKQLDLMEELRTAELRVQQVEYLPRISLFGNYSINAQQNGSPDFFGDPMTRGTSKWVGISITLPVFTGLQRDARIDQKRAVLNQAKNQSLLARLQAESQVKSVLEQAQEARQRARGQKLAVVQAQRGFEIASAQYREGISSQLELSDAEVALRQSEFNYAQAVFDYLMFRAQLDEATGNVPMVNEALADPRANQ